MNQDETMETELRQLRQDKKSSWVSKISRLRSIPEAHDILGKVDGILASKFDLLNNAQNCYDFQFQGIYDSNFKRLLQNSIPSEIEQDIQFQETAAYVETTMWIHPTKAWPKMNVPPSTSKVVFIQIPKSSSNHFVEGINSTMLMDPASLITFIGETVMIGNRGENDNLDEDTIKRWREDRHAFITFEAVTETFRKNSPLQMVKRMRMAREKEEKAKARAARLAELNADPEKKRQAERETWIREKSKFEKQLTELDSNPDTREKARCLWKELGGNELEPALRSGAIALLDSAWLVEFALYSDNPNPILPYRQELPPEAFLSLDEIIDSTGEDIFNKSFDIHIIALSYAWLHPNHPDPFGVTLRIVAERCKELLMVFYRLPPRWGIFWDYASLFQHPNISKGVYRTSQEQDLFAQGLNALASIFSHRHTVCFRLLTLPENYPEGYNLPEGANCAQYIERGWTFVESCWIRIAKSYNMVENLDHGQNLRIKKGKRNHVQPPLTPEKMKEQLEHQVFMNAKDDRPVVFRLYTDSFENLFSNIRILQYRDVGWTDKDVMTMAEIIQSGCTPHLQSIDLEKNSFGVEGCRALADAVSFGDHQIEHIGLAGTCIGDEGVKLMAHILVNLRRVDLSSCRIGVEGCRALAEAAASHDAEDGVQWTHLSLYNNKDIGNEGLDIICPLLYDLDLVSINVGSTKLDSHGCEKVTNALLGSKTRSQLQHVTLSHTFDHLTVTHSLLQLLCELVQEYPTLSTLRLGRVITPNTTPDFKETIQNCASNPNFVLRLR